MSSPASSPRFRRQQRVRGGELPANITTQGNVPEPDLHRAVPSRRRRAAALARELKQYKFGIVSNQLRTLDADGFSAINPGTGFITECARSFWTPTVQDTTGRSTRRASCQIVDTDVSNSPDGKIVEKGAGAYMLRAATRAT
jgi:hypothetical protein